MAKTTKKVQGIHSLIKFQRHQGVESLTIEGKQELADLKQDNKGDTSLILNADKDKVNDVASSVPYLNIAHTTTGEAPNQTKTATLNQDLTQFPLSGGELVKVDKSGDTLTLNDGKVKELVDTKTNQVKTELIGMLPQKVIIEKTGKINNAILNLVMRVEDTIGYISVVCLFTDNTTALIDLSVPNSNYNFDKAEQGVYINWSISRESLALNLYFKKTVQSVETRTIVFGDLYEHPYMETNSLEGTYDSHITTGNTYKKGLKYDARRIS